MPRYVPHDCDFLLRKIYVNIPSDSIYRFKIGDNNDEITSWRPDCHCADESEWWICKISYEKSNHWLCKRIKEIIMLLFAIIFIFVVLDIIVFWALICNFITCNQRVAIIDKFDCVNIHRIYKGYSSVTHKEHFMMLFKFKNPFTLYCQEIQDLMKWIKLTWK